MDAPELCSLGVARKPCPLPESLGARNVTQRDEEPLAEAERLHIVQGRRRIPPARGGYVGYDIHPASSGAADACAARRGRALVRHPDGARPRPLAGIVRDVQAGPAALWPALPRPAARTDPEPRLLRAARAREEARLRLARAARDDGRGTVRRAGAARRRAAGRARLPQ